MIKKQSIWALTLFSLILVLSVYYITLPTEFESLDESEVKTTISELDKSEVIETLKIENKENKEKKKQELHEVLTKEDSTKEDKNNAYEELKSLNIIQSKEEEIELKLNEKYNSESFVEINDDKVKIIMIRKDHNVKLVSEIMDYVQENFDKKMYITVKFENA